MSKIRKIEHTRYAVQTTEAEIPADLDGWLAAQMAEATLLAHADDGLIWGQIMAGQVRLSGGVFPAVSPLLREETLWQLWLFAPQEEFFLWQDDGRWRLRHIQEGAGDEHEYYDETQMLWGSGHGETKEGFTLVYEGQQGLVHAVPLEAPASVFAGDRRPLRLRLRHYLVQEPESGRLRVALSRLVELYVEEVQR